VAALALAAYGAGNGIWSIARGTLPLALFGPASYAALMGRLALPALLAQAVSPVVGAVLLERGGSSPVLWLLVGLGLVNLILAGVLWQSVRRAGG
jgi:hypothetical protein